MLNVFAVLAAQPPNTQTLQLKTFNALGHPKSGGLNFSIAYPSTWVSREGKRPHIVQMLVSPDPAVFFTIAVDELGGADQNLHSAILSKDGLQIILGENVKIMNFALSKLDGEPCAMAECASVLERAGIQIQQRLMMFILPHRDKYIVLSGVVAGLPNGTDVQDNFQRAKPRFQAIASTLVLPDKWLKR